MAFSSDGSAFTVISRGGNVTKSDSFTRISDVQEEINSSWNSSINQGTFGRSSMYSLSKSAQQTTSSTFSSSTTNSKTVRTFTAKKTVTKKKTISTTKKTSTDSPIDTIKDIESTDGKELDLSSSRHFDSLSSGSFFKAKYKDMDGEDFFRSANSRFSMRNINDTSGWNFDLDDGASLFPDFFPKNDAATKLSFEATWRAVSPVKEMGLAKQAIKDCAWEDEQKQNNDAKKIVNSWMQFFGRVNSVKNG